MKGDTEPLPTAPSTLSFSMHGFKDDAEANAMVITLAGYIGSNADTSIWSASMASSLRMTTTKLSSALTAGLKVFDRLFSSLSQSPTLPERPTPNQLPAGVKPQA